MTQVRVLAAILAASLALGACGGRETPVTPRPSAEAMERLTIRSAMIGDYKPVAATVTTRNMGEARARIGGTLVRLNVKEGDQVAEGAVIALVRDERLSHETRAFAAQVAAAEAEAARARADLLRFRTLFEKGFYSKAGLDQAQASAQASEASLQAARSQRAASAEMGAQGSILAPSTGRVLRADVPAGSVVAAGQSIVTVTSGEPLLRLDVPEAQGQMLRVGEAVGIDPADLAGTASGLIAQVYPAVTAGRVTVDIRVPGLKADLVGRRVRVRIRVGERTAMTVPRRFVSTRYGLDYVRVLDRSGQPSDVAVQIAPGPDADRVEVLSGLSDGDVVLAPRAAR